jgi:hypothetical protein
MRYRGDRATLQRISWIILQTLWLGNVIKQRLDAAQSLPQGSPGTLPARAQLAHIPPESYIFVPTSDTLQVTFAQCL